MKISEGVKRKEGLYLWEKENRKSVAFFSRIRENSSFGRKGRESQEQEDIARREFDSVAF